MSIGLEVPMGLHCRCTGTWTGCVAAMPLEGGHVLPTSTWQLAVSRSLEVHYNTSKDVCTNYPKFNMWLSNISIQWNPVQSCLWLSDWVPCSIHKPCPSHPFYLTYWRTCFDVEVAQGQSYHHCGEYSLCIPGDEADNPSHKIFILRLCTPWLQDKIIDSDGW